MAKVSEDELWDNYDQMLNDGYGVVKIGSLEFDPARILKELDPIAYNVGFSDYTDSLDPCDECDNVVTECECEEAE